MARHPRWLVIAAALTGTTPASAQNPFSSFLQQLVPAVQQPGSTPVNRMQGQSTGTGGTLGTDAVAVVEAIDGAPAAGLQFMDYVFSGQTVALGPKGRLTLSYLSGCLMEEISGGTIIVTAAGSQGGGGRVQAKPAATCQAATPLVAAAGTEAGAAVNRVTPFIDQSWGERTIKRAQPMFKWEGRGRPVTVRVIYVDRKPAEIVWQAPSTTGFIEYPANGPLLAVGMPYRVEVLDNAQVLHAATFSIDPELEVPDTLANRVVPVAGS